MRIGRKFQSEHLNPWEQKYKITNVICCYDNEQIFID